MFAKSFLVAAVLVTAVSKSNAESLFSKETNHLAPVQCSKSIIINSKPEKVWEILSDINHWENWQKEIYYAKLKTELKTESVFVWKTGGAKITSTIHTLKINQLIGWTGKTFGLFAIHNWEIIEENGKSKIVVYESMEGSLAKLFKKSFNKNLEKGMDFWLQALKSECEK